MTTEAIRERLTDYIRIADDKKVKAIYTMVEDEIVEGLDLWNDPDFLNEIKSRVDDFESGEIEHPTWEEVKLEARNSLKV
jgi:hypothetical protein